MPKLHLVLKNQLLWFHSFKIVHILVWVFCNFESSANEIYIYELPICKRSAFHVFIRSQVDDCCWYQSVTSLVCTDEPFWTSKNPEPASCHYVLSLAGTHPLYALQAIHSGSYWLFSASSGISRSKKNGTLHSKKFWVTSFNKSSHSKLNLLQAKPFQKRRCSQRTSPLEDWTYTPTFLLSFGPWTTLS